MNGAIHAEEPSYATTDDAGNTKGGVGYDVGFAFVVLLFITILIYTSYLCKQRSTNSRSPPQLPATSFHTGADYDSDDSQCMRFSSGLDDEILSTFPTFLYSETATKKKKADHKVDDDNEILKATTSSGHIVAIDYGSGCSICLADYKPMDVLKLLPECGHLFHVKCVDTWLKVRSTCPVCRNSPFPTTSSPPAS